MSDTFFKDNGIKIKPIKLLKQGFKAKFYQLQSQETVNLYLSGNIF